MDERSGREVLKRCFAAAGVSIQGDHPLSLDAGTVALDGYDPACRVGYEYITTEAGDRAEITPAVVAELEERMSRGELFVLLIDEADVGGAESLAFAADSFLGALRDRGVLG